MKRTILILCCAVFNGSFLLAQSITSANFVRPAAFVDTFYEASVSSVTKASVGVNQTWDYSNLTATGNFEFFTYKDAQDSTVGYPAVFQFDEDRTFDGLQASSPAAEFVNINSAGYYAAAYYIDGLTESLTPVTGDPGDELVIPQQRLVYADTLFYLKFPVTANSSWTSRRNRDAQYTATIASAGLNQTPGVFRELTVESRSVVGTGQVIVPNENGIAFPPISCYLIEVNTSIYDSTFLGGAPAPPTLLAAFNLPQGLRETIKRYVIYPSNGGENPIVSYSVDANNTLTSFAYRPRAARAALSVSLPENHLNAATLYPNPLPAGERLTLQYQSKTDVAQIKMYNMQGALVGTYPVNTASKTLELEPNLQSGVYLLNTLNKNGVLLSSTKLMVQ